MSEPIAERYELVENTASLADIVADYARTIERHGERRTLRELRDAREASFTEDHYLTADAYYNDELRRIRRLIKICDELEGIANDLKLEL